MKLVVDFWDVGQGDASVITLPDGRIVIIDTGPPDSPLVDWLASKPDKRIYAIVLTHNHEDHVGAVTSMLTGCKGRIEHVFFNQSRHGSDAYEKKILSAIWRGARREEFSAHRMEVSGRSVQPIFGHRGDEDLSIYCCHPDLLSSIQNQVRATPQPNKVSAIVCLDINSVTEVVWPGDAPMQTVAKVCGDRRPFVLVGPHHGGPEVRNTRSYLPSFDKVHPGCVFVSVGTDNTYSHPLKHDFVLPHVKRERRLCCSQLKYCDRARVKERRHVMNHHIAMGLLPPPKTTAVTCRGPMQLTWNSASSGWEWDQWHPLHWNKVQELHDPWCVS